MRYIGLSDMSSAPAGQLNAAGAGGEPFPRTQDHSSARSTARQRKTAARTRGLGPDDWVDCVLAGGARALVPLRGPRPRTLRLSRAAAPDAAADPSGYPARPGGGLLPYPDRGANRARRRNVASERQNVGMTDVPIHDVDREIVARIAIPALCLEDEIPLPVKTRTRGSR
jgi:hypothetical protein